jgi:amino acid transporter
VDVDSGKLARFGYAQELRRRLGGFSSFAIGFSVISVITGVTSTFGDAFGAGGPLGLGLGWPLVSCGTLVVACAMAELASAFPTAGALYHWAALLGCAGWGWATAMLNLVGQVAIVAAIDLACAQAIARSLATTEPEPGTVLAVFVAVLMAHGILNALSVRVVARLNDASASVHAVGVVLLAGTLFLRGRAHPVAYLFRPSSSSEAPSALGFVQSLVLGVWTFTGFDAAAHLSEETHDSQRRAPAGIVASVGVSALAGYALVAALVLAVRDGPAVAGSPDGALLVLRGALGDGAGRLAMTLVVLAMWFAGLSSLTSASRMLFGFARDGGAPASEWLRKVDPRTGTPVLATFGCVLAALALVLATARLSSAVFLAVAALATIALYASYGLPIALGAVARSRGQWTRMGPWRLARAGVLTAWVAVLWTAFVEFVCALANRLAIAAFVLVAASLWLMWRVRVRRAFRGPQVDLQTFERQPGDAMPLPATLVPQPPETLGEPAATLGKPR